jgi:membrane protein implicated in regulation of membrane protease activity
VLDNGILDLGIDLNVWPWVWIGIAVLFTLVELTFIGGTFVLLPYAFAACVAALMAFYDVPIEIQWATFLGGGTLLLLAVLRWVRGFLQKNELPKGVGADRLVGTIGIVTVAVEPGDTNRRGRVVVEGEVWGALSDEEEPLTVGTRVRISSVIGTRVLVERLSRQVPETKPNREDAT